MKSRAQANKANSGLTGFPKGFRIPRIIYNDDSCTLRNTPPPHTIASVGDAVDYLKGTQVDCLCWCVGAQLAYTWPSKVIENTFTMPGLVPSF